MKLTKQIRYTRYKVVEFYAGRRIPRDKMKSLGLTIVLNNKILTVKLYET